MATTFTSILLHIVFSTKNRQELILPEVEQPLWNYMAGIISNQDSRLLDHGAASDHVHLLVSLSKHVAVVDLMGELKQGSSLWIKTQGAEYADFYWQEGYGAFSVGRSSVEDLASYFAKQRQHHRRVSFKQEFMTLLKKYDVEYDETMLWV